MSDARLPVGTEREEALERALEKLARTLSRRPRINEPLLAEITDATEQFLIAHRGHPRPSVADDLAVLLSAVRGFVAPEPDSDSTESYREQIENIEAWNGLMRNNIDAVLETLKVQGVTPSVPALPQDFTALLPRAIHIGQINALARRLNRVEDSLGELEKKASGSIVQQSGLLNFYLDSMHVETSLAKLSLKIGDQLFDLAPLARMAENMGELTRDFVATIDAASDRIATAIVESARQTGQRVRRFVRGVRVRAKAFVRTLRSSSGLPAQFEPPAVSAPIGDEPETEGIAAANKEFWDLIERGDKSQSRGGLANAFEAFQEALNFARLTREKNGVERTSERNIFVALNRIGDVLQRQGNFVSALQNYTDGLEIVRKLADAYPSDDFVRRDLSICFDRIGDVLRKQGNLASAQKNYSDSLDIRRRLSDANPGSYIFQRDLLVSFNRIGEVQRDQSNLQDAIQNFTYSLDIARKIANAYPSNAQARRDVSVGLNNMGDALYEQGNFAEALKNYSDDLDIARGLADADASDAQAQLDLGVSHDKLAIALEASGDTASALEHFRQSQVQFEMVAEISPDWADAVKWAKDAAEHVLRLTRLT